MQHLTMKKVGFCSFVIVCVDGERGGDKERVIGRGMGRLGLVALHIICSFLQHSLSNCNYTTQVMLNSG